MYVQGIIRFLPTYVQTLKGNTITKLNIEIINLNFNNYPKNKNGVVFPILYEAKICHL